MNTEAAESNFGSSTLQNFFSASAFIFDIFKKNGNDPTNFKDQNKIKCAPTCLYNYRTMCDKDANVPYIEAEVRSNSIDTGNDPNEDGLTYVKRYGARGDIPAQFIAKKLGGDGFCRNVFPAKSTIDLSESENAQNMVYSFVKDRQDRSAKLFFGITFEEPGEEDDDDLDSRKNFIRPLDIYFKFELYQNDKTVGTALEGKTDNKLP